MRLGVFIQDIYGNLYESDEWEGQQVPNAIAIITEQCQFAMALNDVAGARNWSPSTGLIDGCSNTYSLNDLHYTGKIDTDIIIEIFSGQTTAAQLCKSFEFPNGTYGYLGSNGEWDAVKMNIKAILNLIDLLGLSESFSGYYWTSTQMGSTDVVNIYIDSIEFKTFFRVDNRVTANCTIRAFAPL